LKAEKAVDREICKIKDDLSRYFNYMEFIPAKERNSIK
jgi:hypothetical protein